MAIDQYWNTLKKRWKLIVISLVIVGLGAFIGSKLTPPLYQSTALVQITIRSSNNQADINGLLASDQLVQTEAQLAMSYPVLHEVASHYPGLTVDHLAKNVNAIPKPNTQLFEIDVLDTHPTRAAELANDIAGVLMKQQSQVTQQDNAQSQQQIQQDIQQTQRQISAITRQIASLRTKNGNDTQISTLKTQLDGLQLHYSQWQSLLAQVELTEAQGGNFLRIAQPAQPALSPTRPNVLLNTVVGLLAGLLNGLLLAMLLEQLDTRVRTEEALTALVDWPVLATVWRPEASKKNPIKNEDLVNPPQHSPNMESYRILRTNIGFSVIDKPLHSIMVTSAIPHDGKSTVAANLAIFMAKAGKKTLIIDADLRRPTLHEKFQLSTDKIGLSNAIMACSQLVASSSTTQPATATEASMAEIAVQSSATTSVSLDPYMHAVGVPNLRVMPSGPLPPNPPELLDSKAMEGFFTALASCGAEMIIFDTPPLLGLSDASILGPKLDGVLVVVDVTSANRKNLKQMKAILSQSGSHVLGCVMNKQQQSGNDSAYSYYYYYRAEEKNGSNNMQNGHIHDHIPIANTDHAAEGHASNTMQNGHIHDHIPTSPVTTMLPGQR